MSLKDCSIDALENILTKTCGQSLYKTQLNKKALPISNKFKHNVSLQKKLANSDMFSSRTLIK